jgi:hypothetical protein
MLELKKFPLLLQLLLTQKHIKKLKILMLPLGQSTQIRIKYYNQ